jgi:DNA-binding MarR family transcriptional regulator
MSTNTQPNVKLFNGEEKERLKDLVREGIQVMREIETLNEGINDTIKNMAKEFEVKPSVLKRAIKTAYKAEWDRTEEEHLQLEHILDAVGGK